MIENGSRPVIITVPLENIEIRDYNENKERLKNLNDLIPSIKKFGILHPPIVRSIENGKYEVIAGRRRIQAAREIGLKNITVRVIDTTKDWGRTAITLLENEARMDMKPIERARLYKKLTDQGLTYENIAEIVGKTPAYVCMLISLLKLPNYIKEAIESENISLTQAIELAKIEDSQKLKEAFEYAIDGATVLDIIKLRTEKEYKKRLSMKKVLKRLKELIKEIEDKDEKLLIEGAIQILEHIRGEHETIFSKWL